LKRVGSPLLTGLLKDKIEAIPIGNLPVLNLGQVDSFVLLIIMLAFVHDLR